MNADGHFLDDLAAQLQANLDEIKAIKEVMSEGRVYLYWSGDDLEVSYNDDLVGDRFSVGLLKDLADDFIENTSPDYTHDSRPREASETFSEMADTFKSIAKHFEAGASKLLEFAAERAQVSLTRPDIQPGERRP
jgi:hypothetical protein